MRQAAYLAIVAVGVMVLHVIIPGGIENLVPAIQGQYG